MATAVRMDTAREDPDVIQHPLLSWRTVLGGLVVALLVYVTLLALGVAIGGLTLSGIIEDASGGRGLAWGAGIWLIISTLISLFSGGYFAARMATLQTGRIGAAHGLVIAALFFAAMLFQAGAVVGAAGRGVGSLVGSLDGRAGAVLASPEVQATLDRAFGDRVRGDPAVVAQGVAARLLRGDDAGARTYLARNTDLTRAEIDSRYAALRADFSQAALRAGRTAARAASAAGWTLFGMLVLGTLAALAGGNAAAAQNHRRPLNSVVPEHHGPSFVP